MRSRRRKHVTTTAYRGVVRGGVVFLGKDTPLTEGTEVLVTPLVGAPGSPEPSLRRWRKRPRFPPSGLTSWSGSSPRGSALPRLQTAFYRSPSGVGKHAMPYFRHKVSNARQ